MSGWVCLHRKFLDWEWYDDQNVVRLFIHILLKANYKDSKWRGIDITRGSFITSHASLSDETGLSVKQVRLALDKLKKTGEVAIKKTNKYSVITVSKYNEYQDKGKQEGIQEANKGQAEGKQRATDKQINNKNKVTKKTRRKRAQDKPETDTGKPTVEKSYAFEGQSIRLTTEDFQKALATYPNLDLTRELEQLDLELADQKNWWSPMHAKLNYRNKNPPKNGAKPFVQKTQGELINQHNRQAGAEFLRRKGIVPDQTGTVIDMDVEH